MIAPEKLLYLQMSLRISPNSVCFSSTCYSPTLEEFPFDLCYQFVLQCSAQSCEMAVWSYRIPIVEIPLPFLKILTQDLQVLDNFEDLTTLLNSSTFLSCKENKHVVTLLNFPTEFCSCPNYKLHYPF